ncbi:MAG TPA: undecaprenyl-diphosphatase UppP [Candidatus Binatus sp.]|jgi:undecaprenyl-diphosphatase|nr:undecaprenyl-diphosphatase UppP [Candidatus Binatus sp.]
MLLWQAIILAVVQGLTEFLPVSSSAHLILLPWLSHGLIPDPGLAFDVALHLGTLIAVVLYFLREWVQLILCGLGFHYPQRAPEHQVIQNRRLFWYLVAGTIPGALVGFLFEHRIEEYLRDPVPIAIAMIVIALLMWYAEYVGRKDRHIEQTSLGDSLLIGTGQALALFPGVSRSGITISAGLFRGMTREAAARFSFLLATPLIAGAAAVEVPKLIKAHRAGALDLPMSTLAISIAVSAIVGYIVIAFFLQYLQTRTLKIFIYYRILFGIVVLLLAFLPLGFAR